MENLETPIFLALEEELGSTNISHQEMLDEQFALVAEAAQLLHAQSMPDGDFNYVEYADRWGVIGDNQSILSEMLVGDRAEEALDVLRRVVAAKTLYGHSDFAKMVMGHALPQLKDIMDGENRELADKALDIVWDSTAKGHANLAVQDCFGESFLSLVAEAQVRGGTFENEEDKARYSKLMEKMTGQYDEQIPGTFSLQADKLLGTFANHLGLEGQSLTRAWSNAVKPKHLQRYARANILTMVELERRQPGLNKALNEEFGIKNFARCTPRTWAEMYRQHVEEPGKPYVLALQAADDYNGAFWRPQTFDTLSRQLDRQGFGLKIYECDNKEDVYEASLRAKWRDKVHGAKVASALVLAHGSPSGFTLGFYDRLSTDDLEQISLEDVAEAFGASAGVAWVSCSTGKEVDGGPRSVGHVVARKLGRVSTAPTADVGFGSIRSLKRGPEAVQLQVQYLGRKSAKEKFATRPKPAKYDGAALNAADKTEVLEGSERGRRTLDVSETELPLSDLAEFIHVMDKPVVELGPIERVRDTGEELEQEIVTL